MTQREREREMEKVNDPKRGRERNGKVDDPREKAEEMEK